MESRIETLLNALISGETITGFRPRSRAEEYLLAAVNKSGTEGLPNPQSRLDALLYRLAEDYEIPRADDFGVVAENSGVGGTGTKYVHGKEHDVKVRLTSDTITDFSGVTVKRVGKNLFDINKYIVQSDNNQIGFDISLLKIGETYTISSKKPLTWLKISDAAAGYNSLQITDTFRRHTFKMSRHENISKNKKQYLWLAYSGGSTPITNIAELDGFDIQIEQSKYATEYEPYAETIFTANADGTVDGITSITPVMHIATETENVTVHSKCYREANSSYKDYEEILTDFFGDKVSTFRVPYGTTHLRQYALSGGYTIKTIYIPDSVYNLATNVVYNGYNLINLIFEGGRITTIGSNAFAYCSKLKRAEFGCELAVNMLSNTFTGCTALEEVTFAQEEIYKSIYIQQTSKLKKKCVYDAIKKLKNYIGTEEEYTYYFKIHATVWTNVEDTTAEDYEAPPSSDTWKTYVQELGYNI